MFYDDTMDEYFDRPYVTARCALNEHDYCYDPECSCKCHKVIIYKAQSEKE